MTATVRRVEGIEVFEEGQGPTTVLMLHGWPDTHHLWDGTVAALRDGYRCVRFTLPGFDATQPRRDTSLAEMTALLLRICDAISPDQPVTLLIHDWGCAFGFEFAGRHPHRVARIVGVDVGNHNDAALRASLSGKERAMVFGYQIWLALAWKIGGTLGDRMTRWMARSLRCRSPQERISCQMNYPYAMRWFGSLGGFASALPVRPHCPMLFVYGEKKPFMFHSPDWLAAIAARPGSAVQGLRTGHWVMVDKPEAFHACVRGWLDGAPA